MSTALCRRHRRPDVVVASTTRPGEKGQHIIAPGPVRASVAALAVGAALLAAGCGGGNGKAEPPKLVSKTFVSFGDSYVRATEPRANYGKNTELRVDGSPTVRTYLAFQPFGLPGKIVTATLRFYALSTSTDGFQVRSTSGSWSESRLTFDNAPSVGKVIGLSGSLSKDHWRSIDVKGLVRSPTATVRMALVSLGPTELALASRETPSRAPQLIFESRRAEGSAAAR
jgi:hypothetical protein